ncbi:zinc finger BED domain-containing protein RICESLEEPER 2-like [Apium graveolens]|uniref:zinc finger BED domain-containing protein RICESLEEPER 2-like n=1 Tax=Apium graveolens TaxID=4045 RepID=UPI003D7C0869
MAPSRKKKNQIEIIPENAEFEQVRSLGDDIESEDAGENGDNNDQSEQLLEMTEQEEISRKRKSDSLETQQSQPYQKKPRKKTARCWPYLDTVEENNQTIAICKFCKERIKCDPTGCTTTLNRHVDKCRKENGQTSQALLQFQPIDAKSSEKIGYMVVTGHWIDSNWNLNMRVLNFCNVPPPHSGFIISEALFKCLDEWGIIDKIGTLTVDNAAANDVALRYLKQTFSVRRSLSIEGKMFHARCCAHILNLCMQDGLNPTEDIVDKVRDGVKYIAASESRRIKFAEISKSLGLKCKKLILDVLTRWNSTYNMLECAIQFKNVFLIYSTSDPGFKEYVPGAEDWEQVEGVCSFLKVFSDVTKVVSGTGYSTSNLFLSEIRRVKHIIDRKAIDPNMHVREMARKMEMKFEKYWGETNLVMSIGAVMDPRFKMKLPAFCFPTLYPIASDAETNMSYLLNALNDLYFEYCREENDANKERNESGVSSSDANFIIEQSETPQGINDYESFIRESGGILEPTKSELEEYLSEKIIAPSSKFDVLAWWKGNSAKYPILSKMAFDVLSILISTVASESTFSAGGRVIELHRSCLKPETVEVLLCGADWVRELYGLKKLKQEEEKVIIINLD